MRGQHGLGPLEVGVAREDDLAMPLGRSQERPLKPDQGRVDPVQGIPRPQLDVRDDLIVAASGRVQLATHVPQLLDQGRLDVHVDVFALEDEREVSRLDLRLDFRQGSHNLLAFVVRDQADRREHPGVRLRTPDIVLEKPTVKGDGFRELFHPAIGPGIETTTPGFLSHSRYSLHSSAGA